MLTEIYSALKSGPMTTMQIRRHLGLGHDDVYRSLLGLSEAGVVEYRSIWKQCGWYVVE